MAGSRDDGRGGSQAIGVPRRLGAGAGGFGRARPSIVIAAILQRGEEIKSAGGYLRVLTAKARAGEFSLGPVLMALLRGKAGRLRERESEPGKRHALGNGAG